MCETHRALTGMLDRWSHGRGVPPWHRRGATGCRRSTGRTGPPSRSKTAATLTKLPPERSTAGLREYDESILASAISLGMKWGGKVVYTFTLSSAAWRLWLPARSSGAGGSNGTGALRS